VFVALGFQNAKRMRLVVFSNLSNKNHR